MLVRLWAGPSCIARAMSRRMSSWAPSTILVKAGDTATRSAAAWPAALGPAPRADRPAAISATTSRYRPRTLALPSSTSTWASMRTARLVSVTSCSARSSCTAGSPAPAARAATRRSATWALFASWRPASVRACWTSSSISSSSFCIVSACRAVPVAISATVTGVGGGVAVSLMVANRRDCCRGSSGAGSVFGHPDPALTHRVDDGLGPVIDGQLAEDRAHVVLDGLLADRQGVGDLLVGHALGDVVEDLHLARGERGEDGRGLLPIDGQLAEFLEDPAGDRRLGEDLVVDQVLAQEDTPDDRDQVVRTDVLEDEGGGTRLDRIEQGVLVLVDRQDDDPGGRQLALDALGRLDAAGRGQREVHEDDVGRCLDGEVECAAAVVGLTGDLEVGLLLEDVADADPEQGMVVDDEDLCLLADGPPVGSTPPPLGPAVVHRAHLLSSPVGIDSTTTVPPAGRDRTSKRAPISSARSLMNWRPKLRRPRDATAPTSNPLPSSRTSRFQSVPAIRLEIVTRLAAACLRTFCRASWATRSTTVCSASASRSAGACRSVSIGRPVSVFIVSTESAIAPSRPSCSRSGGRSCVMKLRTSPSSRRNRSRRKRSSVWAIRLSWSSTLSIYST